jgi:type IV pilus assembly protein PilW
MKHRSLPILVGAPLQRGFSLVELMVALVLGLLILVGLVTLFANQSVARGEIDKASRQIENGRYAMHTLVDEVHLAGYYGPLINAPTSAAVPNPCLFTATAVASGLGVPLQVYAGAATDPTPSTCLTGYKANTAVLVIRRAETVTTGAFTNGEFNIQVSGCQDNNAAYIVGTAAADFAPGLYKRPTPSTTCPTTGVKTAADITPLYVRIYYISTCSNKTDCTVSGADSVPTLRRIDVKPAGLSAPTALVDGIENLQAMFGKDTDATPDGIPNAYDSTVPTTVAEWSQVMALRLYVLARNVDATGTYTDAKTYDLGAVSVTPGGNYKRHAYSEVARLNNVAERLE